MTICQVGQHCWTLPDEMSPACARLIEGLARGEGDAFVQICEVVRPKRA